MATSSFGKTFIIKTKYGRKNFEKALESLAEKKEKKILTEKPVMASKQFIKSFLN